MCVGLQPGVREVAGALRAAGWAGEAPASVKNATKTGVEETWRSCRKSLRDEVKLTIVKPATIEMTSGWCQLLPKVAVSQCSACTGLGLGLGLGLGFGLGSGLWLGLELGLGLKLKLGLGLGLVCECSSPGRPRSRAAARRTTPRRRGRAWHPARAR